MATYPYAPTNTSATTTVKPVKPLPTWDNTVQNVPLATPNQQAKTASELGNEQVLQAAQQKSMGGFQSPVMDQVVAGTQNLLKDPSMGKDYAGEKQLQLEQQNRNMNQQLETLRQQTAPQAYTGQNLRDLTNVAMQAVQQRADTGRTIDIEQNKAQREAMIQALTQGQGVAQQERGAFDQDIQNLIATRGAMEGEANRTQQSNMLDKTFLQDVEKMKLTQDWEGIQNGLDREIQKELAAGNWNNAITLTQMKGQIDKEMQASEQSFQQGMAIAERSWKTGERISSQDYEVGQNALDREERRALQNNDIAAQERIADKRAMLELTMQTNEMNQQEKMAYLTSSLEEARANGDVTRQKEILSFTHTQEMEKILQSQGFEAAQAYNNQQFQLAMQNNDFIQARVLQENTIKAQAEENTKDRVLEQARIALTEKGLDMQQVENRYNMILSEIDAGRAAPDAAVNYLNAQLAGTGIKITAVDNEAAMQDAIDADYKAQEYQYIKTHMNDPLLYNQSTGELTPEGQKQFLNFINQSVYGERGPGTATMLNLAGKGENDPIYQSELNSRELVTNIGQLWGPKGDEIMGTGQLIKINDPTTGDPILVSYKGNAKNQMSFITTDGRQLNYTSDGRYISSPAWYSNN